jgi:hypothetical protein
MTAKCSAVLGAIVLMWVAPTLAADRADSPVDRVADVLAAGEVAATGEALVAAASRLDRLAAHPLGGGEDLAARWRTQGAALGVKDETPPMRGRALGPAYRSGQLAAGAHIDLDQIFLGGEAAVVVVVPQAGRSLHVRISDADQMPICGQAVEPPKAACRWLPVFTTRFRISLTNPAATAARYYLVSN